MISDFMSNNGSKFQRSIKGMRDRRDLAAMLHGEEELTVDLARIIRGVRDRSVANQVLRRSELDAKNTKTRAAGAGV